MSKTEGIMQNIKSNPLPWLVQVVTMVFFVGNLYMATQLFPLIRNIDSLVSRVDAIEKRNEVADELIPRFIQLEERDRNLVDNVEDIKNDVRDIKNYLNVR